MILEVCCGNIESVSEAVAGGAGRIELCSALSAEGVTPSLGLIGSTRVMTDIPVNVLVREREGNFVYTRSEIEVMAADISTLKRIGVNGVVIGALTSEREVDIPAMQRLMHEASGLEVTFHRAFDFCADKQTALEIIIALGCKRILTSGGATDIVKGKEVLKELNRQANGRIKIMAGGGLNPENAAEVAQYCGLTEVHGSCRKPGNVSTDANTVKKILSALNNIQQLS